MNGDGPGGAAYFERVDEDVYRPTRHTEGPWDPRFQHFGPPGALIARGAESALAGERLGVSRIAFDILGPVPLRPLTLRSRLERPGRRVALARVELIDGDRPVALASAWGVRPAPDDPALNRSQLPDAPLPLPQPPGEGDDGEPAQPPYEEHWRCGFLESMQWHFVKGGYATPGPATVWLRPRYPLLADEPMSPVQRTVLCADSANGVSAELDVREWGFIPPELTVHLVRPPHGEWLCLDAETTLGPGLVGLTTAGLYDTTGLVARSAQTLLVSRR